MTIIIYFTADTVKGPFQVIRPTSAFKGSPLELVQAITRGRYHGFKVQ